MECFSYAETATSSTITHSSGQPNGDSTSVLNGTRTVTETGAFGEPLSTRTQQIIGGAYGNDRSFVQYWDHDDFQRPQRVTYLDGTVENLTVTAPDQTKTVSTFVQGQLKSVVKLDSGGAQLTKTTYNYDNVGRLHELIDDRNGTTTYAYPSLTVQQVTLPSAGSGYAAQTTTTTYDARGLVSKITHPDNGVVSQTYWPTMQIKRVSGARTYPVEYDYDAQGRMLHLYTWQLDGENSTKATTTWAYDAGRGWLKTKRDNAGKGADYTYTPGGRLKTRTWARSEGGSRILTTYKYGFDDGLANNEHGDLASVTYSDSTPGVTYTYDRLGRQATVVRNGITTTLSHNEAGQLLSESYAGGTLGGLAVALTRDNVLRRYQMSVTLNSSTLLPTVTHLYNTAGRLDSVSDGSYSAGYEYAPNSAHLYRTTFKQSSAARLVTTRDWDYMNRLRSISSTAGGFLVSSHAYHYNAANQRDRADLRDGSYWNYHYDSLGQVDQGKKHWEDSSYVPGEQFEYTFDDIGNRTQTKAGGDGAGGSLRTAAYTPNLLNQYQNRSVPGAVDILGATHGSASVTINGASAAYRHNEFYERTVAFDNSAGPANGDIQVSASLNGSTINSSGKVLLPPSTESFIHDDDGNLTSDGLWIYAWDAENRLVQMVSRSGVPTPAKRQLDFEYDFRGRRIRKTVSTTIDGTTYGNPVTTKFLYDGWNLMGELDANNVVLRNYVWGLDLSGTVEGAGGVSGLLFMRSSGGVAEFATYDGNGNVTALVDGATAAITAQYEYGPIGELVRATGPLKDANPFSFSTKFRDAESGDCYYGYRYYSPSLGRWLSRDPIAESGGFNLLGFCDNDPIHYIDAHGREVTDWTWVEPAANVAAGVSDSLTMGITSWFREKMNIDAVDYSSGLYYVGEATEFAVETTVTLGAGVLRKKAAQYSGQAGRYLLEANARKGFRKAVGGASGTVRGGVVHHWNPIRQGRFPLPYKWAARGHWNMTWLQNGRFLTAGQKHRFQHWYLKMLDAADVTRAWSSPIRSAGNAIIQYVNALGAQQNAIGKCPPGPDLTIEVVFSVNLDAYNEAYTDIPDSLELPLLD